MVIVGRVHLNAGGKSPQVIRMGSRGASERLRPPGDDISPARTTTRKRPPRTCEVCRSARDVASRNGKTLCTRCRDDQKLVTEVRRLCQREGLPPVGVPVAEGSPYEKLRRDAAAASRRLTAKKPSATGSSTKGSRTATKGSRTATKGSRTATKGTSGALRGPDLVTGGRLLRTREKALVLRLQEELTSEQRRRAQAQLGVVLKALDALGR
jgi:hypothetical protein